jgi:hypothetical protein
MRDYRIFFSLSQINLQYILGLPCVGTLGHLGPFDLAVHAGAEFSDVAVSGSHRPDIAPALNAMASLRASGLFCAGILAGTFLGIRSGQCAQAEG